MSFADHLCKQFERRPGPTKHWAWSGSKLFDTDGIVPERICWKSWFWKQPAGEKKSWKNYPISRELISLTHRLDVFVILFDLILYVPVNNFSVMLGQVFLDWTSTKQGLINISCSRSHNTVTRVRLKSATPRSWIKQSTTGWIQDVNE